MSISMISPRLKSNFSATFHSFIFDSALSMPGYQFSMLVGKQESNMAHLTALDDTRHRIGESRYPFLIRVVGRRILVRRRKLKHDTGQTSHGP